MSATSSHDTVWTDTLIGVTTSILAPTTPAAIQSMRLTGRAIPATCRAIPGALGLAVERGRRAATVAVVLVESMISSFNG